MNTASNYLFNFKEFVEELRNNEDKKDIIEKYEDVYGSLVDKDYTEQPFYTDYVAHFEIDELMEHVKLPEEQPYVFDYKLLFQLVLASFSSDYMLVHIDETNQERLRITVTSGGQSIVKDLDELWRYQILRLFEIYFEEQMNLATLIKDNEDEEDAITCERETRVLAFERYMARQQQDRARSNQRRQNYMALDLINETA